MWMFFFDYRITAQICTVAWGVESLCARTSASPTSPLSFSFLDCFLMSPLASDSVKRRSVVLLRSRTTPTSLTIFNVL